MADKYPIDNVIVGKQWFPSASAAESYRKQLVEPTFVYFIQRGEAGAIKIGYAKDPAQRLRNLQVGADRPLRLVAVVPGGMELERELHREFGADRLSGEWFRSSSALIGRIRELTGRNRLRRQSADFTMEDTRPPKPRAYWDRLRRRNR